MLRHAAKAADKALDGADAVADARAADKGADAKKGISYSTAAVGAGAAGLGANAASRSLFGQSFTGLGLGEIEKIFQELFGFGEGLFAMLLPLLVLFILYKIFTSPE